MVQLSIIVPEYSETLSFTVDESLTVRQLIFNVRSALEAKGITIDDIINYGLYHSKKKEMPKLKAEKTHKKSPSWGKSFKGSEEKEVDLEKIEVVHLKPSTSAPLNQAKISNNNSHNNNTNNHLSISLPVGNGVQKNNNNNHHQNNNHSVDEKEDEIKLRDSEKKKSFKKRLSVDSAITRGIRRKTTKIKNISEDIHDVICLSPRSRQDSPSDMSPTVSSSNNNFTVNNDGVWLDKKLLISQISLTDQSLLQFMKNQDFSSIIDSERTRRNTAPDPAKGRLNVGSNENSKVKYLLKERFTRNEVVNEVVSTEKSYVQQLETLITIFVDPAVEKAIFTSHFIIDMLRSLKSIYLLHAEVLFQLEKRMESWSPLCNIADVFLQVLPYLKLYGEYCVNYSDNILELLQLKEEDPKISKFIRECEADPRFVLLQIDAYLILPVQRIPRYRLLFEQVLKFTPPDHGDFPVLNMTLNKINEMASYINSYSPPDRRLFNANDSISNYPHGSLIDPKRKMIKEGLLKKSNKERKVFLFSDMIVYCVANKKPPYSYKGRIELNASTWIEDDTINSKKNGFLLVRKDKSTMFNANSVEEKQKWMEAINSVIQQFINAHGEAPKNEKTTAQRGLFKGFLGGKS